MNKHTPEPCQNCSCIQCAEKRQSKMENPAEEIQAMHTELEQLRDRLRTENDAQGYEILQLRADKARLVEALDKSNKYLGSHPAFNALRQCRDNKQLLTEIEQK